jgi:hypothetical protein
VSWTEVKWAGVDLTASQKITPHFQTPIAHRPLFIFLRVFIFSLSAFHLLSQSATSKNARRAWTTHQQIPILPPILWAVPILIVCTPVTHKKKSIYIEHME